jgi:hypothetical protein
MSGVRSAAEWLEMAEHARTVADDIRDPASKRQMVSIAEGYEALAGHAEFLAAARRLVASLGDRD